MRKPIPNIYSTLLYLIIPKFIYSNMQSSALNGGLSRVKIILGTMTFGGQTDEQGAIDILKVFTSKGYRDIDTARMYCHGNTEVVLGKILKEVNFDLNDNKPFVIASKVNAFKGYDESLSTESVKRQSDAILASLQKDHTDILYLHGPDIATPIEETLAAVQSLYEQKRFKELGVSNYAAWEVAYIHGYMRERGWVLPTVYQGMYNCITRDVEKELFLALKKLNIRFYAYNPLCGGLLTGKHKPQDDSASQGTRFDASNSLYRGRYWKDQYFKAINLIQEACAQEGLEISDCSLRWLVHHSGLLPDRGDGVIVGASSVAHLRSNLVACESPPLPPKVLDAIENAWTITRPVCEKYFRP